VTESALTSRPTIDAAVEASDSRRFGLEQLARVLATLILTRKCVSGNLPLVVTYEVDPWDALGDGTRRAIFKRLVEGPRSVGELANDLPVSRPAVSQHLRVLKEAGLVSDRAEGTRRVYAVHPAGLARLRGELDRFWTQALDAFKAVAEKPPRRQREKQKEKKR
jgi:DNA-binding transcriptional ArsR family regulator